MFLEQWRAAWTISIQDLQRKNTFLFSILAMIVIRVGISVSANMANIDKTNIFVSMVALVPIYRPICYIGKSFHIGWYRWKYLQEIPAHEPTVQGRISADISVKSHQYANPGCNIWGFANVSNSNWVYANDSSSQSWSILSFTPIPCQCTLKKINIT